MSDADWVDVAALSELAVGQTRCVELAGHEVLLCRTADGVYAVDNLCSHAAARLCDGKLKGGKILCPLHGAAFDVKSGEALTRPAVRALASYAVKIADDRILLQDARQE